MRVDETVQFVEHRWIIARPGHHRDKATEPPLARAIALRAKRPMISVEIFLR